MMPSTSPTSLLAFSSTVSIVAAVGHPIILTVSTFLSVPTRKYAKSGLLSFLHSADTALRASKESSVSLMKYTKSHGSRTRSRVSSIERVREPWDFVYFMRLTDDSFDALKAVSAECKKLNKPLFAYFLVGTDKNVETVKMLSLIHISEP